ncbi:MAG: tetratricopeptide repeat protein [Woeseiaceae bacterium]|nr:tetratricopeptide repeat protein [Woeseiaceae bacterium]
MPLAAELRRRNVFRVAAAYLIVGWLLTEVLTTILPELGAPEWSEKAVIYVFVLGFFAAVILAWFFELTPEGIKRDEDVAGDAGERKQRHRLVNYVTLAGIALMIVFVALFSAQQVGEDAATTSVAVLPFVNMSNDADNEYFSDGLTETLLHMLAQIPDLKVAARTSSFAFKGQNMSVREIADALGVAYVLEGSVQRAGDRVRVTAQLINASDESHVWSNVYEREIDDIFGIQDEIAKRVGSALSESLLGTDAALSGGVQTLDPDAYDLYLRARKERLTFSYGGLKVAEDLLKGALLIDPDFVEAKTELATSYISQWETGLMEAPEAISQVSAIADQVLSEHPDNVVARAAKVYVEAVSQSMQGDFRSMPDATRELESLVADEPENFQVRLLLVRAYVNTLQDFNALSVLEAALEQDPFNPQINYELGTLYFRLDRPEAARIVLEKSLEIEPMQPNARVQLAHIDRVQGDGVGFVKNFLTAIELDPRDQELPGTLAQFLYQIELLEEADDFRRRVLNLAPTSAMAYRLELLRAMGNANPAAAEASARRAIENRVYDRMYAFHGAVEYLLRAAIASDTVDAELAWLDEQLPSILDVDAETVPGHFRAAQGIALDAWYVSLPLDETRRRLDVLIQAGQSMGFDPTENPMTHLRILAIRGEIQEAIRVALDGVFSRSVTTSLGWRETFATPMFSEIVADPRVQVAMQQWEQEEAAIRSNVSAYLQDIAGAS